MLHTLRDLKRFFHGPSSLSSDANEPNCWKVVKKRVCEEHAKCNTTTHKVSSKDPKYTLNLHHRRARKVTFFLLHCFWNSLSRSMGNRTGPRMRTQSSYEYVMCLMEKLQLSLYICRIEWVEIWFIIPFTSPVFFFIHFFALKTVISLFAIVWAKESLFRSTKSNVARSCLDDV